jgi:hypothetical protein
MYKLWHGITDSNQKTSLIADGLNISETELRDLIANLSTKAESISGHGNVLTYIINAGDSEKVVGSLSWKEV